MKKQKQKKNKTPDEVMQDGIPQELRELFWFSLESHSDMEIITMFQKWARYFFPQYFISKETGAVVQDSSFHDDIDLYNTQVYRGSISSFTDIVFRGGAKTTRTKLFVAFMILNDGRSYRRYFKVLTKDFTNSKQVVTDIYNMFVAPQITAVYPDTFEKTEYKREETMQTFTTAKGIKILADTVGVDQRGQLQEDARPDFVWFDDFETRKTLRSAPETKAIGDNMEEARTGLSAGGACIYTCNYISERGNVHQLVLKENNRNIVLIVPIEKDGIPAWPEMYDIIRIEQIKHDAEDYEGEYLCEPSAGADVLFDRDNLKNMIKRSPVKTIGAFKMFKTYDASHRYALGADVAGGVGLDSSTSVIIDFDTIPCRVVSTYKDNLIKPDVFGMELASQGERYGECLIAPEKNNHGHATIAILKQNYSNIFETDISSVKKKEKTGKTTTEYGWQTNTATKPKMMMALRKAVDDGQLDLNDKDLIQEAMSYSRDDLMDKEIDPRLTTRHFDLLIATAIAWQMKDYAAYEERQTKEEIDEIERGEVSSDASFEDRFGLI
jgi:hypothetical protein